MASVGSAPMVRAGMRVPFPRLLKSFDLILEAPAGAEAGGPRRQVWIFAGSTVLTSALARHESRAGGDRTARPAACPPSRRRDDRSVRSGRDCRPHQHLTRPALDIEDGHLCGIEAAGQCRDREEHGLPAGQPFRPYVIGFSCAGSGRVRVVVGPPAAATC
jgi:hypothetical protein